MMGRPRHSVEERLDSYTQFDPNSGCWLYEKCSNKGYGSISVGAARSPSNVRIYAHRAAYERAFGPIPSGLVIDHKCRTRACVNPAHLRAVTLAVNCMENSVSPVALNRLKTHCIRGHEFTGVKKRGSAMGRRCRTCDRAAGAASRLAKRDLASRATNPNSPQTGERR